MKNKDNERLCPFCGELLVRFSLADYFDLMGFEAFNNMEFVAAFTSGREKDPFMTYDNFLRLERLGII